MVGDIHIKDGECYIEDEDGNEVVISAFYQNQLGESRFSALLKFERQRNCYLEDKAEYIRKKAGAINSAPYVAGLPRPKRGLIVIINGCGRSGKDTFERFVTENVLERNCGVTVRHVSTIDPIRTVEESLATLNHEPYAYDKECHRKACSELKRIWDEQYDGSFKCVASILEECDRDCDSIDESFVVFVHVREPKNIERIYDEYLAGSLMPHCDEWEITSLLLYGRTNPDDFDNDSDREVENFDYDVYINNGWTMSLKSLAEVANQYANIIDNWRNFVLLRDSAGILSVPGCE